MTVERQTAIIYLGSKGLLRSIPVKKVREFEKNFLDHMEAHHRKELDVLRSGKLTDEVTKVLEKVCSDMTQTYSEA